MGDPLLTERWLKESGFKWHQLERQSGKHWLLWLGAVIRDDSLTDIEDLGIEVAAGAFGEHDARWFCWLRSDVAHRYSRFLHLRHIRTERDLVAIIQGITGVEFKPENARYGYLMTDEQAARDDVARQRLDRKWLEDGHPWRDIEKDPQQGGALPEHLEAHEKAKETAGLGAHLTSHRVKL